MGQENRELARFVAIRLLTGIALLWAIYTLTFAMAVIVPGTPFGSDERTMNPQVERAILARYHADDNWRFYWDYLDHIFQPVKALRGEGPLVDFGPSWQYRDWGCNEIVASALPVSVGLGLLAMLLAVIAGVPIGVFSAVRRGGWFDFFGLGVALIGISMPIFVTGMVLLIVFSVLLDWLPVGGWGTLGQMVLPAVTLSLPFLAYIARLTRLGMLDVLGSDYVRTARAKGLSQRQVVWKHALRNAILPVVSFLGPACAAAMTGSFVVENIYNIPGMGQHFVAGIINRDRGMILATVLVYSAIIIFFNILVDVSYAFVDPRIKISENKEP
jgi:oligopeptide transport system permease protein